MVTQTFQRFMNMIQSGLDLTFCYLDDILVAFSDEESWYKYLHTVFQGLSDYGLCINVAKCIFGISKLNYLEYKITIAGIRSLPTKADAIKNVPSLHHLSVWAGF